MAPIPKAVPCTQVLLLRQRDKYETTLDEGLWSLFGVLGDQICVYSFINDSLPPAFGLTSFCLLPPECVWT